ncbi:Nuclear transcription factor Y subunit gamma [Yarrowia sp. E02]|nr:Nuclear transcription factor Y subunit gamma [Yarrowia sp. E02]
MSGDVEMRDSEVETQEEVEVQEVQEVEEVQDAQEDAQTETTESATTSAPTTTAPTTTDKTPNIKLPLARTKRIVNQDDDVSLVSVAAYAAINAATQDFVRYLSEQAGLMARMDQRKTLAYKDVAEAISKNPKLEFLQDIIPKTIPARSLQSRGVQVPKEPTGNISLTNFFKPAGAAASSSNAGTGSSTPVRASTATSTPAPEEVEVTSEAIEID